MKRRKILSFAMALVMCISMCMPGLTAYAVDPGDTPPAEPECNCEDKCTEGSIDPDCSVCSADGADLSKCTGTEVVSEPECDCTVKCTVDSINGDCAVCGVAEADLTQCKGAEQAQAPVLLGDPKAKIDSYDSLTRAIADAEDNQDTTIQLTGHITGFDQTIEIPANKIITLDLNGYNITSTQEYNTFLSAVTVNGTLNLYDRSQNAGGTITGNGGTRTDSFYLGGGIYVSAGAKFNMHNGHVGGNHQAIVRKTDSSITISGTGGCGVYVADDAIFNMYGGYIEENSLGDSSELHIGGAGVLVLGGTFNMFGGYIQNNAIENKTATGAIMQASASGAGVSISYGAKFNMTGGYITNNRTIETSGEGCGVVVDLGASSRDPRSTFEMSGGEISNNIIIDSGLSINGAGVFCAGDMEISGNAKITSNKIQYTATNDRLEGAGGGVYCTQTANFKMSGGEISENAADVGGGIYVYQTGDDSDGPRGKLEICDGKITGNTAEQGGGIYFEQNVGSEGTSKDDAFTMSGGEITGNTAERGGGIYTTVQFKRTAGMLCNNTATKLGDDAVIISQDWPTNAGFSLKRLGSIPEDEWQLTDDCQHTIDGWYIDGCKEEYSLDPADPRWNASTTIGDEVSSCIPGKEVYAESYTGTRWPYTSAIKAAHGNKKVKTYTLTYDEADASNEYQMSEKTKSLPEGSEVLLQLDGGTLSSQPAGTYDNTTNTWDIVMTQNVVAGTPTRAGYYFAGWMVQEHSGTGYDYILKARWTPEKTMRVLFDFNGGINPQDNSPFDVFSFPLSLSSESLDSISTIRSQKNALADIVEKDGYLFVDWERVTTGTVSYPDYSDKTIYSDETVNIDTPSDQLVVYRAVWKEPAQYSIRFDSNGGSPVEKHIEFDESDLEAEIAFITELQNFNRPDSTRAGYILDYWYIDLLEYYISNGLISENNAIVVNARAARIQAEQQYAEGKITEDEYWHTLISDGFFYNMDVVMELQEDYHQEELIELFGPGAKLGYGLGCYWTFMQNFERTPTITLTAKWTPVITIRPANMISYIGGSGYSSAVDEEGNTVSSNGLPEPGFVLSFPEELSNIVVQDLYLQYKESNDTTLKWKFVKYGDGNHNVYRIEPADGTPQRDVRIEFINADGKRVTNDSFNTKDYLNQSLRIEIYGEGIEAGKVFFAYQGKEYGITVQPATLTVRGTTSDVEYAKVLPDAEHINGGDPGLVANAGTTYTINNSDVHVDDASGISLLFDEIINSNAANNDRTNLLQQRTDAVLGQTNNNRHYDFKYLDLVDQNNGNTWVKADQNITVYWPLPEGTNANTQFKLLHFAGAHRSLSNDQIQTVIQTGEVETMKIKQVTDTHVVFEVGSGGFSPFALVWETKTSGTGGGSTGGGTDYILHYESNGGTEYKDERYSKNTIVELDKVPTREGYTFTGWYADKELTDRITSIKMTSDKTVYAGWEPTGVPEWLNGDDHFAYVIGYTDSTVRPLSNISRAEVAAIFFRLLNEDIREKNLTTINTFDDVNEGMWCNMAISTIAKLGIVKGRTTEHFDPNAPITRAEFAAICARFDTSKHDGDSNFTDISGYWAEAEIERAASLGWVRGYTDGTFRPSNHITRAEAMTMINRVLKRLPEDEDDLLDGMNVWPDNKPDAWYYLAVQEATNSHDFTRKSDAVHEHWTKMTTDPNWTQYQ